MITTDITQMFDLSFLVMVFVTFLLFFYTFFAFMAMRQVRLLNNSLKTDLAALLSIFSTTHFFVSLGLLIISIISVISSISSLSSKGTP